MAAVYKPDSQVVAIRTVHSSTKHHLPVLKNEILTVVRQDGYNLVVDNKHFIRGFVNIHNVQPVDIYTNEAFFLMDFTAHMAQSVLADHEYGTFVIRSCSRDPAKLVISVIFERVIHYTFCKKDGGIEYDGVAYKSLPSFINKCSTGEGPTILDGNLRHWLKQADVIKLPLLTNTNLQTLQKMSVRIVAGCGTIATDDMQSHHGLCLPLFKGNQYTVIQASRDPQFYIARDEHGNEGYVPAALLECYIPDWFHGRLERDEAEGLLNKTYRDGTFLVRERPSKPGWFALSVWCPDGVIHVPLAYNSYGQIRTGPDPKLPVFECILDLVEHYRKETAFWTVDGGCVRTLFPLSRVESSLPDEVQQMDLESIELYFKALHEGRVHVRDVRLMLVGHYSAGKTTLTERLMGKPFKRVGSTNGIDIHVRTCQFNLQSGQWSNTRPGSAYLDDDETLAKRLATTIESPDEERTSIFTSDLATPKNITNRNSGDFTNSSNRNSGDFTNSMHHNNSTSSTNSNMLGLSRSVSGHSLSGSPSYPNLTDRPNTPENSYQIDEDFNDIAHYKFSIGTLKAINQTFGRKRCDSTKEDRNGFISMWDFAGQYIYYATHQVFLSSRAVYLLVLDLSKSLEEFVEDEDFPLECADMQGRQVKDYATLWLRSIHTFCGNTPGQPPVILVGTHKDQMSCRPEQREEFAEKYFEKFRTLVENIAMSNHIQPEQFALDNTSTDEEFKKLKEAVVTVAKRQQHWNQEIPARWLPLERSLHKLRPLAPIVTLDDIVNANAQNKVKIEDEEEVLLFLRYHHAMGGLIYFDDDEGLANSVVLDPQWIVNAFKCLITAKRFCKLHAKLRPLWLDLQEKAMLKNELIEQVWQNESDGSFVKESKKLLLYMEKLDIIAKPMIILEDGSVQETDFYFVPSLFRNKSKPNVLQVNSGSNQCTPNLCFVFEEGFVPPVIFQRMLGACMSKYPVLSLGGEVQLYFDLGIFKLDACQSFLFKIQNNVMKIQVVNLVENKVQPGVCDKLRRFMTSLLESELGRYQQNMAFSVCIECERSDRTSSDLINCRELLKSGKLPCCAHCDPHVVSADVILCSWYPDYVEVPQGQTTLLSWINDLPSSVKNREVTPKDLSKISKCLGYNWELVPIELGLSQVDVNQSKMDFKSKTALQIYDTLSKWKAERQKDATILALVKGIQANNVVEVNWEYVKNVVDGI